MTSYLFVVRIPVEKDQNKDAVKPKQSPDSSAKLSGASGGSGSEKEDQVKTKDAKNQPQDNKNGEVIGKENGAPQPVTDPVKVKPDSTVPDGSLELDNKNNDTESEKVDLNDEKDLGKNEGDKTSPEADVDVEWDFGDDNTDQDQSATADGNTAVHVSIDFGVDNTDGDLDVTTDKDTTVATNLGDVDKDKNKDITTDKEIPVSGKEETINEVIDISDSISISKFIIDPVPEVEIIPNTDNKKDEKSDLLKAAGSTESLNSKKFIVESVTGPVLEETAGKTVELKDPAIETIEKSSSIQGVIPVAVASEVSADKVNTNNGKIKELATVGDSSGSEIAQPDKRKLSVATDAAGIAKSSSAAKLKEEEEKAEVEFFLTKETLLKIVINILKEFGVENITVNKTDNEQCHQVIFVDEGGEKCENILNKLADAGVGNKAQTTVSIYQSTIFRGGKEESSEGESDDEGEDDEENDKKESEFKKSIKARMLVTEVVDSVRSNAEFTFDYLLLVILASIISALGLVENSSVVLVASMLISPLMGPILAGTFGTVIKNDSLRNLGLKSESLGLLICTFSGFCFGLVSGGVSLNGAKWGSTDMWPTNEMMSRGMIRSLWVGALIALPSGAGVALSVLGGNTGSLVGVAISASLLPPAVNAGMLWAYALLAGIKPPATDSTQNTTENSTSDTLTCPPFLDNAYKPVYDCNMAKEAGYLGLISLSLTLLNILCIFVIAIIVLKIKEVAPQTSVSDGTRQFWAEDIQIARDSYATSKGPQSLTLAQQARELMDQWRLERGHEPIHTLELREMIEEVENSDGVKEILGKLSFKSKPFSSPLDRDFRRAEEDVTMAVISDHRFNNEMGVYHTFHGRPQSARILSPSVFPRRAGSLVRRKPKTATIATVDEVSPPQSGNIALDSNLYKRRKKEKKIRFDLDSNGSNEDSVGLRGDESPLLHMDTHI